MPEPPSLSPLLAALRAVVAWLEATGTRGVIIGGVAASLLGRPRVTGDVDALVLLDEPAWDAFVAAGARHGIVARRKDAVPFARRNRVLLLRHEPSGIDLDVSLGMLPFEEEVVARARRTLVGGVRLRLPTPEDLIVMKAIAHRARDLGDIEGILTAHPRLDRGRVRRLVGEFAAALEAPEILADLEAAFARSAPVKPRRRRRGRKARRGRARPPC